MGLEKAVVIEKGERVARWATVLTLFLVLLKGSVGILTNTPILIADALHSLVDLLLIAGAWLGLHLARRPPSERFPYGYYRAESLAALFISIGVIWGAIELILEGLGMLGGEMHEFKTIPLVVAAVSAVLSFVIARREASAAREAGSASLEANAAESYADVLTSVVVFLSLLVSPFFPFAEGVGTIIVALWVLKVGVSALLDAIYGLMDTCPPDVLRRVRDVLDSQKNILGYGNLRLRKSGPVIFGEVDVYVGESVNVARAQDIAREVEEAVRRVGVDFFRVHVVPKKKYERVAVPVSNGKVSPVFGRAEAFLLFMEGKVERVENPGKGKEKRAGLAAAKTLLSHRPDAVIVRNIGEIAFHTLRDNGVDIFLARSEDPEENVRLLREGKLPLLTSPTLERE